MNLFLGRHPFSDGGCVTEKNVLFSFYCTAQKMKFSITNFFSKCDQIRRKLRIWSHLLKKSVMVNFIFCAMLLTFLTYFTAENSRLSTSSGLGNLTQPLKKIGFTGEIIRKLKIQ